MRVTQLKYPKFGYVSQPTGPKQLLIYMCGTEQMRVLLMRNYTFIL